MSITPKIQKALLVAALLHRDQRRKTDDIPYIVHPYTVALILSQYTRDDDIIAAGLLHDVLEDVPNYSASEMVNDFGEKIYSIVREVSEEKSPSDTVEQSKSSWEERKLKYVAHLRNGSMEALLVCCADKIHNLSSMIQAYDQQGEKIWERFNAPKDKQLWYYREVLQILRERLHSPIVDELDALYAEAKTNFSRTLKLRSDYKNKHTENRDW